jgi:hypothetical protein
VLDPEAELAALDAVVAAPRRATCVFWNKQDCCVSKSKAGSESTSFTTSASRLSAGD